MRLNVQTPSHSDLFLICNKSHIGGLDMLTKAFHDNVTCMIYPLVHCVGCVRIGACVGSESPLKHNKITPLANWQ